MAEYPRQRKTEPWELMIIKLLIAQPLPDGFIKLSQELRDRIYAPLFATGDTSSSPSLSPPLNEESLPLSFKTRTS